MKFWLIVIAIFVGTFWYNYYEKEQRKERQRAKEAACLVDPVCRAQKADFRARMDSIFQRGVVGSLTGTFFFRGRTCLDDCTGHIAGYEWASRLGISKEFGCGGKSDSFIEGCLQYVQEQSSADEDESIDDRDSCTPGRYGDC